MKKIKTHKVLHLATHLGGGVGSAVLGYLSKAKYHPNFFHKVVCLNYVEKNSFEKAKKLGVEVMDMMNEKRETIHKMIEEADLVLVHWWNHPLLYDFLVREQLPACRMAMWSHISGLQAPNIFTDKLLQYSDKFVFTTPISLDSPIVKKFSGDKSVIWSTGGVEHLATLLPKKHRNFNIGYVGTLDHAKLYPGFLDLCSKIDVSNAHFIVCGDDNGKKLKQDAKRRGLESKFSFLGWVSDVPRKLATFDLFGYPLSSGHYGTCDHSLQESMAAGVVPVVFGNKMERFMVEDGVTGLVVNTEAEYITAVQRLYRDEKLRKKLSDNAKKYALRNFSTDKMASDWKLIFKEMLKMPKTSKKWDLQQNRKILPRDVFLESIGSHGKTFLDYCNAKTTLERSKPLKEIALLGQLSQWSAETKGTVHNYNDFLPNDKYLSFWSKAMRQSVNS